MTKKEAVEALLKIKKEQFEVKSKEAVEEAGKFFIAQVEQEMCEVLASRGGKYRETFKYREENFDAIINDLEKSVNQKETAVAILEKEVEYLEELVRKF